MEASPLFLITGRPHSHGKNTGTAPPCFLSLSQVQDLFAFLFVRFRERYDDVFWRPVAKCFGPVPDVFVSGAGSVLGHEGSSQVLYEEPSGAGSWAKGKS